MADLKKQNKNKTKKIQTQVFRHCYVKHMHKISGKNSKPTLVGAPGSLRFLYKKHWFFPKKKSLSKITYQYFSVQNQYNQTIKKLVLKSNFQDIHKP